MVKEERRGEENVKWRLSGGRQRGRHSVVADRDGKEKGEEDRIQEERTAAAAAAACGA